MSRLLILSCLISLALLGTAYGQTPDPSPGPVTDDEINSYDLETIIVLPKVTAAYNEATPPLSTEEAKQLGLDPQPRKSAAGSFDYKDVAATTPPEAAEAKLRRLRGVVDKLKANPKVKGAWLNLVGDYDLAPNDPHYSRMWNYHSYTDGAGTEGASSPGGTSIADAWNIGTGSSEITVAVLDSGYLPKHADVSGSGNVGIGYDFVENLKNANDSDGRDADPTDPGNGRALNFCAPGGEAASERPDNWHGAQVAGMIGIGKTNNNAGIAGINFDVRVLPLRVAGRCGWDWRDVRDAMLWAVGTRIEGLPENRFPARILNVSLGVRRYGASDACPEYMQRTIDMVNRAGAILVVSAGNDRMDAGQRIAFSSCKDVIVAAAGNMSGAIAGTSNFGEAVNILAPGAGIISHSKPDEAPGGVAEAGGGTSMAAAHVSGVLALMLAQNSGLSRAELTDILRKTARPRTAVQCPNGCGWGLLDAHAAVMQAAATRTALAPPPRRNGSSHAPTVLPTRGGHAASPVECDCDDLDCFDSYQHWYECCGR